MANICQIRVLSSGKYCCESKHLTVRPCCVGEVSFTNLPLTTIEVETTPDNWTAADPATIEGDGCVKLYKSGTYRFGVDCEALNGTLAPEEGAIGLCYDTVCYSKSEYLDLLLLECVEDIKECVQELKEVTPIESSLAQVGCVKENNRDVGVVMACKKSDQETGEVLGIELWGLFPGQDPVQDYQGPWEVCVNNQDYKLTGTYVNKPGDPSDCLPVWTCINNGVPDSACYVFSVESKTFEVIQLSNSEINVPSNAGSKVFMSEVLDFIQVQAVDAVATVADALALAVSAGLPDLFCKETGQSTPATIDDICAYKVRRLPCPSEYLTDPTDITTVAEVGPADRAFVGGVSVNLSVDEYGAVDPARSVLPEADAVLVWCFQLRRELTKAEIAAL